MQHLQIELTNKCNLTCIECPHRLMKRPVRYMDEWTLNNILEKLPVKRLQTVIVHKDGEPLLHPSFEQFLTMITQKTAAKIDIYTNGFLINRKLIEFLSALDNQVRMLVSFHFKNADGSINDYGPISRNLLEAIEFGASNIEYVLATHEIDHNDMDELWAWKKTWERVLAQRGQTDAVHVNTAINPWTGLIEVGNLVSFEACPYGNGEHFFIGVTGNILACCMDLEEEIVFGNINDQSVDEALVERKAFYQHLNHGDIERDVCRRCLKR